MRLHSTNTAHLARLPRRFRDLLSVLAGLGASFAIGIFSPAISLGQSDPLAQSAFTTILGDLTQEIQAGSTVTDPSQPVYIPITSEHMVPVRNTPTDPTRVLLRVSSTLPIAFPGASMDQVLKISLLPAPYTLWKISRFQGDAWNPSVAGDNVSPAGDGFPNLIKYALGLEPFVPSADPLTLRRDPGMLTLGYRLAHAATDITVQAEWFDDLIGWKKDGVTQTMLSDSVLQLWEAKVLVAPEESRKLMRLHVTWP